MKNLKKLTAVLCTLVMLLALCACGNTAAPAADSDRSSRRRRELRSV